GRGGAIGACEVPRFDDARQPMHDDVGAQHVLRPYFRTLSPAAFSAPSPTTPPASVPCSAIARRSSRICSSLCPAALSLRFISTVFTAALSVPNASSAHCGRASAISRPRRSIHASGVKERISSNDVLSRLTRSAKIDAAARLSVHPTPSKLTAATRLVPCSAFRYIVTISPHPGFPPGTRASASGSVPTCLGRR